MAAGTGYTPDTVRGVCPSFIRSGQRTGQENAEIDAPIMSQPSAPPPQDIDTAKQVLAATMKWIEKAVIGLGLCPFAAVPYRNHRVRYCVSEQRSSAGLRAELARELQALQHADPMQCETTLLIHPQVLSDFRDQNDFLDECDATLTELGLDGELQIASFHPSYQFAGTHPTDIENHTNRSPYPILHLLREASIAHAVASFPQIDAIGTRNIETLRRLGHEGWLQLWSACVTPSTGR